MRRLRMSWSQNLARSTESFLIEVRVKSKSRVSELVRESGGTWVARVQSAPVDGKANAELISLVASRFGCAKAAVSTKSGASSRTKLVKVIGAPAPEPDNAA